MSQVNLLEFNVKVLKFLNLWPRKNGSTRGVCRRLKDLFLVFYVLPSCSSATVGLYFELLQYSNNFSLIIESLIAIACCGGMFYIVFCFVRNREKVIKLVDELNKLSQFGTPPDILKVDKDAAMYAKFFLIYCVVGTTVYATMPMLTISTCEMNKTQHMKNIGIPCGLVMTQFFLPFRYDYRPRKQMVGFYQITVCIAFSSAISGLTTLLCGILMHDTAHLRHLCSRFRKIENLPKEKIKEEVRNCVRYHIAIIEHATQTNDAFSSMMLLHITVTSFVISVLGYQVLLNNNITDSLRYGLHLGGWLSILLLICYNGQKLIEESTRIGKNAYFAAWYNFPVSAQKDVLLIIERAQRPLVLTALNFGVISLPTYLQVMSTAYSYFTLLLKMKS